MNERHCVYCDAAVHPSHDQCPDCGKSLLLNGRYRLQWQLGEGGFGVVYAATDTIMRNRLCAIKRVLTDAEHEVQIFVEKASRFAFIPHSYDRWSAPPYHFHVMEYIEGKTLVDERPIPWSVDLVEEFLHILLNYLVLLHDDGIIHRDLKPANIKKTPRGRSEYMLLDFGIAKRLGELTGPGLKAASRYYAPPEQWVGESTDERADLYSLAATAYLLLTGRVARETLNYFEQDPLMPPSQLVPGVPPALDQVLVRMLQLRPEQRPASARQALAALGASEFPALARPAPLPSPLDSRHTLTPTVPVSRPAQLAPRYQFGKGSIVGVGWAEDGRSLVVVSTLGWSVYDAQTLYEQRRIETGMLSQPGMCAQQNDNLVIATSESIQTWQISTGALLGTLRPDPADVPCVALTPDGRTVVVATQEGAQVWREGTPLVSLQNRVDWVSCMAVTFDGETLATASREGVQLWRLHDGALIGCLPPIGARVMAMAFAPDGQLLAVAADTTVQVYRTNDGIQQYTVEGHTTPVVDLAFAPNGLRLASASDDAIMLWRARDGALRRVLEGESTGLVSVGFAPDGQTLAAASGERVRLWSVSDGTLLRTLRGYMSDVRSVAFAPNGQLLAVASDSIQLWQVSAGTLLGVLEDGLSNPNSIAFSPDGQILASASSAAIELWQTSDWTLLYRLEGHTGQAGGLVFAADGQTLIAVARDSIQSWDVGKSTLRATRAIDLAGLYTVALGSNGQTLAAVYDRVVQLWHADEVTAGYQLEVAEDINGVALAQDGATLAVAMDAVVEIWRVRDGDEDRLHRLPHGAQRVMFSPDDALLASAGDKGVQIWDVTNGALLASFEAHRDGINDLAFAPDSRLLASASQEGTVRLWDLVIGLGGPS